MKLILGFVLCLSLSLKAQNTDEKLAAKYFADKDYTKAADVYEDLAKKQPENVYYYDNLLQCYISLKDYKSAEKLIDKRIKKYEYNYSYKVDKGYLYNLQNDNVKRDEWFAGLLKTKVNGVEDAENLANAFLRRKFYDEGLLVYLNSRKTFNNPQLFADDISQLYFIKGNKQSGTEELVNIALNNEYLLKDVKDKLTMAYSAKKDYDILTKILLTYLQKKPDNISGNDLLIWSFIQQKDWEGALFQSKAIDKRLKEEGRRILELAWTCQTNEVYEVAMNCYTYVKMLGTEKPYYYQAQQGVLENGLLQIKAGNGAPLNTLRTMESEYLSFLKDNGNNWQTAEQMKDLADLYIYYLHEPQKGIVQLTNALNIKGLDGRLEAACKLDLGDAQLISGDPWEADLLYKQVEKAYTNDALGQEAKYRYARLCYYRAEFDWSQTQLDVLKSATTQLISNNAIRLWLLIQDNTGLDTSQEALQMYANAELLIFQNKYTAAAAALDEIPLKFPNHTLADEIYFAKALMAEKQANYNDAIVFYSKVIKDYSFDILADNALINLAKLYEFKLNDTGTAKIYYEKIILNYTGSLFINEARKRYRIIRGDAKAVEIENYWD